MELLAATVLAVPFLAGRELLLSSLYEKVMVFSLVSLRGLHQHKILKHPHQIVHHPSYIITARPHDVTSNSL